VRKICSKAEGVALLTVLVLMVLMVLLMVVLLMATAAAAAVAVAVAVEAAARWAASMTVEGGVVVWAPVPSLPSRPFPRRYRRIRLPGQSMTSWSYR
jgi:hypothetical protein